MLTTEYWCQGILLSCNEMAAEYLFMTDKIYDPRFDTGDKVIQCGRHNDIFKLWLQWRGKVGLLNYRSYEVIIVPVKD